MEFQLGLMLTAEAPFSKQRFRRCGRAVNYRKAIRPAAGGQIPSTVAGSSLGPAVPHVSNHGSESHCPQRAASYPALSPAGRLDEASTPRLSHNMVGVRRSLDPWALSSLSASADRIPFLG